MAFLFTFFAYLKHPPLSPSFFLYACVLIPGGQVFYPMFPSATLHFIYLYIFNSLIHLFETVSLTEPGDDQFP